MWSLKNDTSYTVAERGWIRDIKGTENWIVSVKITYDLLPDGSTRLSTHQVPINYGPVTYTDNETLQYETDMGPAKQYTDVIINGHAQPHNGKSVLYLPVGIKLGKLSKVARVFGNRVKRSNIKSIPAPFLKMPLTLNRMWRGSLIEQKYINLLGMPLEDEAVVGQEIANIEPIIKNEEQLGFGVIPIESSLRQRFAGTYDKKWQTTRYPLMPEDMNHRLWQIAPISQQIEELKGGELVILANFLPTTFCVHPLFRFLLPKAGLIFDTHFFDNTSIQHRPKIHSIILEPDFLRVSVIWHSALACHSRVNLLSHTRIWEKKVLQSSVHSWDVGFPEWEALNG